MIKIEIKKIIALVFLIFISISVFGQWSSRMNISDAMIKVTDTSVQVSVTLSISPDSLIQRDYWVHFSPMLSVKEHVIFLPKFGVCGKTRERLRKREETLQGRKYVDDEIFRMRKGQPYYYSEEIPKEEWMKKDTIVFLWQEKVENCCKDLEEFTQFRILAKYVNEDVTPLAKDTIFISKVDTIIKFKVDTVFVAREIVNVASIETKVNIASKVNNEIVKKPIFVGEAMKLDIKFATGKKEIDLSLEDNADYLKKVIKQFDSLTKLHSSDKMKILISGSCSPDGKESNNRKLSGDRAVSFFEYVIKQGQLDSAYFEVENLGENWIALRECIETSSLPLADEKAMVDIIKSIDALDNKEQKLRQLKGGSLWKFILEECFPDLRKIEYKILNY